MSTVAEILSSAQGGKLIENLAHNFGLTTEQTQAAVEALTPALALGLQNATKNPQVLEQVVAGLVHPTHQAAFEDPATAHGEDAGALGKDVVFHLYGADAGTGQIVQIAAREVGIRADVLNRLLPVLVSVVLGGLFKNFESQGLGGLLQKLAGAGALGTILSQLGSASAQAGQAGAQAGQAGPASGGGQGGGALGGLLGALLGALLGGGASRQAQPQNPQPGQAQTPSGGGLEDVLGQLIKTLNTPHVGASAGQTTELQDVLDKVFPKQ